MLNTYLLILQTTSDMVGKDMISKLGEWSSVAVIMGYLIFQLIKDIQRNKKESLKNSASLKFQNAIYQQLELSEKLNKQLLTYLKIVSLQYADELSESQMKLLVEKVLEASKYAIKSYITKILRENHIEGNENEIRNKIKQYVHNRYQTDILLFKQYSFRGETLDTPMLEEWRDDIYKSMSLIVMGQRSEKDLQTALTNKFDEFNNKMLSSILSRKTEDE